MLPLLPVTVAEAAEIVGELTKFVAVAWAAPPPMVPVHWALLGQHATWPAISTAHRVSDLQQDAWSPIVEHDTPDPQLPSRLKRSSTKPLYDLEAPPG